MLKNGALVAFLLSLLLSKAIMETIYTSLNITSIVDVTVRPGGCYYNGITFDGIRYLQNPCQRLSCHPQSKILVKMECGDLAEGCHFEDVPNTFFPACCRVRCPRLNVCVLKNGTLMKSGETINSSDPCLRYMCNNGFLFTQKCPMPSESSCTTAYTNTSLPYPDCCGLQRSCVG